jgi:hypothetical protein
VRAGKASLAQTQRTTPEDHHIDAATISSSSSITRRQPASSNFIATTPKEQHQVHADQATSDKHFQDNRATLILKKLPLLTYKKIF